MSDGEIQQLKQRVAELESTQPTIDDLKAYRVLCFALWGISLMLALAVSGVEMINVVLLQLAAIYASLTRSNELTLFSGLLAVISTFFVGL